MEPKFHFATFLHENPGFYFVGFCQKGRFWNFPPSPIIAGRGERRESLTFRMGLAALAPPELLQLLGFHGLN